jgi:hypothetical protein
MGEKNTIGLLAASHPNEAYISVRSGLRSFHVSARLSLVGVSIATFSSILQENWHYYEI